MKLKSVAAIGAVSVVAWLQPVLMLAASSDPPSVDTSTTAAMPLDLDLARKLVLPEALAEVQKIIGTPGGPYVPDGLDNPGTWYRWYHDCGNSMSFGDVAIRDGQAISLWFEGCAGETIKRFAKGDFYMIDADGKITYLSENERRENTEIQRAFSESMKIPCVMMALTIELIDEEHTQFPTESRDELVARYATAALADQAVGADIKKIIEIGSHFVDYVESNPGTNPSEMKERFVGDCVGNRLPW